MLKIHDDRLHAAWCCSPAGSSLDPDLGVQTELHNLVLGDYIRGPISSLILFEGIQVDIGAQWDGYAFPALGPLCESVLCIACPSLRWSQRCCMRQHMKTMKTHGPAPARGIACALRSAAQLQPGPKGQT